MPIEDFRVALIIPTLNAFKDNWHQVLEAISEQELQPDHRLILDSGSSDNTVQLAKDFSFEVHHVPAGSFDHAGTRKWGISLVIEKVDIIIFMTQDAVLADGRAFRNLIESFSNESVAIAYGRQLPQENASPIEAFARHFNYPERAETRQLADKARLGMKVAFSSDAFAAYRCSSLEKYDPFPDRSIVGEDFITAARLLFQGEKLRYAADARVTHSHDYTITQEFKRYFDIGVFHKEYEKLLRQLGATEKSGANFVKSELKYLLKNSARSIPLAITRTISKYLGYKIGKAHTHMNRRLRTRCSMHAYYFNNR